MDIRQSIRDFTPYFLKKIILRLASSCGIDLFIEDLSRGKIPIKGILDIGAADGIITDLFLRKIKSNDIAIKLIEPRQEKFSALQQKYCNRTNCVVYDNLITNNSRDVQFATKGNGSSIFDIADGDTIVSMKSTRIDELLVAPEIEDFFVKIDVQGAEMEVLESFGNTITRVAALAIECNNFPDNYKGSAGASDVIAFLARKGFELYSPGHIFVNKKKFVFQFDLMFLRRDLFALLQA